MTLGEIHSPEPTLLIIYVFLRDLFPADRISKCSDRIGKCSEEISLELNIIAELNTTACCCWSSLWEANIDPPESLVALTEMDSPVSTNDMKGGRAC